MSKNNIGAVNPVVEITFDAKSGSKIVLPLLILTRYFGVVCACPCKMVSYSPEDDGAADVNHHRDSGLRHSFSIFRKNICFQTRDSKFGFFHTRSRVRTHGDSFQRIDGSDLSAKRETRGSPSSDTVRRSIANRPVRCTARGIRGHSAARSLYRGTRAACSVLSAFMTPRPITRYRAQRAVSLFVRFSPGGFISPPRFQRRRRP